MQDNSSISNSKARLVSSLILLTLLVFVCDYALGGMLKYLYFGQKGGEDYETTYAINKLSQDVVILGSSRASRHYVPAVITNGTGLSCYNAGRDAMGVNYIEAILTAIITRYKPKLLLVDLTPFMIDVRSVEWPLLSCLLPYYYDHPEIRPIISKRGQFEWIKMLSRVYPFNSTVLVSLKHNLIKDKDYSGYIPLRRTMTDREVELIAQKAETESASHGPVSFSKENLESLRRIIHMAQENDVPLVMIVSPFFNIEEDRLAYINKYAEIFSEDGIPFLNFSGDPDFLGNNKIFADKDHLNDQGARLFTEKLVKTLLKIKPGVLEVKQAGSVRCDA